ncbi:hypothetical protein K443DRAFT_652758 [Laccaria amethystina LaAM-08-1]|uniref:Uncharacterized protein n=1 Tax=Laccaria amethystina LaAM-08-1 TaxID=1095629 RepID=A0A0C9X2K8_9AGAR|nr:hypothetical protein K443DRAFT_652758 [Laccaria amethystina LaAM-08-1]
MLSKSAISFIVCVWGILNLLYISIGTQIHPLVREAHTYRGHDYPETLPLPFDHFENVLLTVEESHRFTLLGHPSGLQWARQAPAFGGYVRLGPENRLFLVSMFHKFHCLRFFNWALDPEFEGLYKIFATEDHSAHCLNYLRQMILCSPDLTLEKGDFRVRNFVLERSGSAHTCRWMYNLMEDNWDR